MPQIEKYNTHGIEILHNLHLLPYIYVCVCVRVCACVCACAHARVFLLQFSRHLAVARF